MRTLPAAVLGPSAVPAVTGAHWGQTGMAGSIQSPPVSHSLDEAPGLGLTTSLWGILQGQGQAYFGRDVGSRRRKGRRNTVFNLILRVEGRVFKRSPPPHNPSLKLNAMGVWFP